MLSGAANCAAKLLEKALESGGPDNHSCIVVDVPVPVSEQNATDGLLFARLRFPSVCALGFKRRSEFHELPASLQSSRELLVTEPGATNL